MNIDDVHAKLKRGENITPAEALAYRQYYVGVAQENMARTLEGMARQLRNDARIDMQHITTSLPK